MVDSRAEMMGYPWAEPKVAQSVVCSVYWTAAEMDAMLASAMVDCLVALGIGMLDPTSADCLVCWRTASIVGRTAELMGIEMVGMWVG